MRCGTIAVPVIWRSDIEADAQLITIRMLDQLPELRKLLADDVQAAFDGDPAAKNLEEILFCYPGMAAVTVFRIAHELFQLKVPLIPRMMTEYAHAKTGIDIHPGATIGRRFFIDHGTGVVIGETTHIGEGVKIYQGVTLGALSFPRDEKTGEILRGIKRHPTIEDEVVIYANATILGGKTVIGHHSVVGSSCLGDALHRSEHDRDHRNPPAPLSLGRSRGARRKTFSIGRSDDHRDRLAKMIQPPARRLGKSQGLEIGCAVAVSIGNASSIRKPAARRSERSSGQR